MKYKAEYINDEFAIIEEDNDFLALKEAHSREEENGTLLDLFEVDEDYNNIRTVF